MAIKLPICVVPLPLGTITTGNERSNFPASHLDLEQDAGMVWKSNGNGGLYVRGDFGIARNVDFVALMSANATSSTTIRVRLGDTQAEVDGTADYDSGALPFISPAITNPSGIYHSHLELPSVQNKQWWRIDIGGHTGDFQASTLVMGQRITPSRYYDQGYGFGIDDLGTLQFGQTGVVNEEYGIILRTLRFRLSWLTEAEWEQTFRPILEGRGQRGFLYWCLDPEPHQYRQNKTYLGPTQKTPSVVASQKAGTYAIEFEVTSPYVLSLPDTIGTVVATPPPSPPPPPPPPPPTSPTITGSGKTFIAFSGSGRA